MLPPGKSLQNQAASFRKESAIQDGKEQHLHRLCPDTFSRCLAGKFLLFKACLRWDLRLLSVSPLDLRLGGPPPEGPRLQKASRWEPFHSQRRKPLPDPPLVYLYTWDSQIPGIDLHQAHSREPLPCVPPLEGGLAWTSVLVCTLHSPCMIKVQLSGRGGWAWDRGQGYADTPGRMRGRGEGRDMACCRKRCLSFYRFFLKTHESKN